MKRRKFLSLMGAAASGLLLVTYIPAVSLVPPQMTGLA